MRLMPCRHARLNELLIGTLISPSPDGLMPPILVTGRSVLPCKQWDVTMPFVSKKLYDSSNGDGWSLITDTESGRMFVRHEANLASGGRVSEIGIEEFLSRSPLGPEHAALRDLLAEDHDDH